LLELKQEAAVSLQLNTANNGKEGIEKSLKLAEEGRKPDLILMDIHMPVMDGISATKILRENKVLQNIPIVIMSANVFESHRKEALSVGVDDFLIKPVELEKLDLILCKYLRLQDTEVDSQNI